MIRTYLAGPLRGSLGDKATPRHVVHNTRVAREHAELLWQLGFAVFCPHLNTHEMVGMLPDENTFLQGDLEWLAHAELVVMLPGWQNSAGSLAEHDRAKALGIPLLYVMYKYHNTSYHSTLYWEEEGTLRQLNQTHMINLARMGVKHDRP